MFVKPEDGGTFICLIAAYPFKNPIAVEQAVVEDGYLGFMFADILAVEIDFHGRYCKATGARGSKQGTLGKNN